MRLSKPLLLVCTLAACDQSRTPPPAPTAPADCAKVGEIVASFELGTAAKPDVRTAAVTRHRDACKAASLTVAEANCIARAKSTWDVMACAPKMFPERATGGDCKAVATKMRVAIAADMPKDAGSSTGATLDKMLAVIETSCTEDNWPAEFRQCILGAKPEELTGPSRKCDDMLSQQLQLKMGERMKPIVKPDTAPTGP